MPNHLAGETSPYLLQHAENPVDWHPWGEEVLAQARREERPILLSIGYSACHWCHVMAHESFEDAATAAAMNRLFVNIKVDREERPDLDHIYQLAHQMLTGRAGGWPLTLFLTPQGVPFFAGTYFPPRSRHGLPAFGDLLEGVARAWVEQRQQIFEQNGILIEALGATVPRPAAATALDDAPLRAARAQLGRLFDPRHGGFGGAPKFPHPTELALLLASPDPGDRERTLFTLFRMADGGIYDQLGGGFYRYSVDDEWSIPHFEKMLYDNAQLLPLYAEAWALTGEARYRQVAEETVAWLAREMTAPGGGFYSAVDADADGEEGRYYVWQKGEVAGLLEPAEYAVLARRYGLDGPPNFEGRAWHLRVLGPAGDAALLAQARDKLRQARERRTRLGCDDKILASWNGLMIGGLIRAGRRLEQPEWTARAQAAVDYIRARLWVGGRLLATCKDGRAHLAAYVDDYAFLLAACLESLQASYRPQDLEWAVSLADCLLACFEDAEAGGFYFTAHDHEPLLHRPKIGTDNATPAGNGVAALGLFRLAQITADHRYRQAAQRTVDLFSPALVEQPGSHATMAAALAESLNPGALIVLRGPEAELPAWQSALARRLPGNCLCLAIPGAAANLPAGIAKPDPLHVNAWVCEGVNCLPPVDSLDALLERFAGG